jgi:hypothetical protein
MSERDFQMRLTCRYADPTNQVVDLRVEHLDKDQWRPLELGIGSPGFHLFVYAIFSCQHLYVRTNCAELGLMLDSAEGRIHVAAGHDWTIDSLHLSFAGRLRAGTASPAAIQHITERMSQCPASINLRSIDDTRVSLRLS